MTLDSIIERLEKAESGDRWLDAQIHGIHHDQKISVNEVGMVLTDYCVLGWIDPGKESVNFNPSGIGERMLRYTESVDAAIALAEKVLPGWAWKVGTCCVSDDAWVTPDFNSPIHGERLRRESPAIKAGDMFDTGFDVDLRPSGRPAIALCIAVLTALKAKQMGVGE